VRSSLFRSAPDGVIQFADEVAMEPLVVSYQLRTLRQFGLVTGQRTSCWVVYSLHADHVL
jgi:predicted transcriptional regulator